MGIDRGDMTDTLLTIYFTGFTIQIMAGFFFLMYDSNARGFRLLITSPVWPLVYLKAVWMML
jgi:hypothetical protein